MPSDLISTQADHPLRQPLQGEFVAAQDQAQIYQELVTNDRGELTTSFLSIDGHVKDNRLQPHGFLPQDKRLAIARALGDNTPLHQGPGVPMDENVGSDAAIARGFRLRAAVSRSIAVTPAIDCSTLMSA